MATVALPLPHARPREHSGASGAGVRWVVQVLAWMVILPSLAILLACVAVPRVTGATPYTILTGSMRPHYPPGTLVVVKPATADEIGIGTIVTYQLRSGDPTVVTHRVVAMRTTQQGEVEFQTKGDANNVADAAWVKPVQVKGRLWYSVPKMGYLSTLLNGQQRSEIAKILAYALFGYALAMFVLAILRPNKPVRRVRPTRPARSSGPDDAVTELVVPAQRTVEVAVAEVAESEAPEVPEVQVPAQRRPRLVVPAQRGPRPPLGSETPR